MLLEKNRYLILQNKNAMQIVPEGLKESKDELLFN